MNRHIRFVYLPALFCLTGATSAKPESYAFIGVNVIWMDRKRVLTIQVIIVRDGVIAAIGDAAKIKIPQDAPRIEYPKL